MPKKHNGSVSAYTHEAIAAMLRGKGYTCEVHVPIGQNIYGKEMFAGVLVKGVPYKSLAYFDGGIAIECRTQETGGSTDEKLPFFILNILQQYPCRAVLLLDGDGWSPGAIEWAHSQVGMNCGQLVAVHNSLSEFKHWLFSLTDPE